MKWKLKSEHSLQLRCWGDECVVYNDLSGDTHLVGSVGAQILHILQRSPSDSALLNKSIASFLNTEINDELILQLEQILMDFDKLALIERT